MFVRWRVCARGRGSECGSEGALCGAGSGACVCARACEFAWALVCGDASGLVWGCPDTGTGVAGAGEEEQARLLNKLETEGVQKQLQDILRRQSSMFEWMSTQELRMMQIDSMLQSVRPGSCVSCSPALCLGERFLRAVHTTDAVRCVSKFGHSRLVGTRLGQRRVSVPSPPTQPFLGACLQP